MSLSLSDKELMMLHIVRADTTPAVDTSRDPVSWKHYGSPVRSVVHLLANHFLFDQRVLTKQLSDSCRPLFLTNKKSTLFTLSILKKNDNKFFDIEYLTFLIKDRDIVTFSSNDNSFLSEVFYDFDMSHNNFDTYSVVFDVLRKYSSKFFEFLSVVNDEIEEIEEGLRKSIKNKEIFYLLEKNKMLNLLASTLKSNLNVLRKVSVNSHFFNDENVFSLNNILVEMEQAQIMAETHNINLSNLMDAYSAAVENNLSLVVQYLSVYVIVAAVPMGIAGIYGMNTPLPLQDEPYVLALLSGVAVLVTVILLAILKVRRII